MRKITIYIDGGSRGNPGPSAIGAVFYNERGDSFKKYSEYLGNCTNNEAEYQAVIFAMKKIKALFGKKTIKIEIEIRSDSELLIKQLNGEYKVLDPKIQQLFLTLWNLKVDLRNAGRKVQFSLLPREKNEQADKLVNKALDARSKNQTLF